MARPIPRTGPRGHRYRLRLNYAKPSGAVFCEPDMSDYAAGERVILTAVPAEGKEFFYWRVDLRGNENPTELVMDRHKHVVAVFRKKKS